MSRRGIGRSPRLKGTESPAGWALYNVKSGNLQVLDFLKQDS